LALRIPGSRERRIAARISTARELMVRAIHLNNDALSRCDEIHDVSAAEHRLPSERSAELLAGNLGPELSLRDRE